MISFVKKHTLVSLYLATLGLYLAGAFVGFGVDALSMSPEQSVDVAELELSYLEIIDDNTLISTGDDPQIIIYGDDIRSVYYRLQGQANGTVAAYYTYGDTDYSDFNRLTPEFGESGEVLYTFPREKIDKVRIDPGSVAGEEFVFEELTINKNIPLSDYIIPSSRLLLFLIILPCIIYAVLSLIFSNDASAENRRIGAI